MKKITIYLTLICCSLYLVTPLVVFAADDIILAEPPSYSAPVIITEIQTGANTASDEFIELYNTSDRPIDITGWQLRYSNATSTGDSTLLAAIVAHADTPMLLPTHGFFVLHTASIALLPGVAEQVYSAKLSSADKVIGLFAPNLQTCLLEVNDAIAWGASAAGEGPAAINPTVSGERLVQRYLNTQGYYADTNANKYDVSITAVSKSVMVPAVAVGASPGFNNSLIIPITVVPQPGYASTMNPLSITGCILPEDQPSGSIEPPTEQPPATIEQPTEDSELPASGSSGPKIPARDIGLKSPQVTELLPNPGKPLTDVADEFIELYNSNEQPFELTGFMLEVGSTSKKRYTFPSGTVIEPKSFKAFFSAETHLGLSNTQGQATLLDPFGNVLNAAELYGPAKDNQSWALANGIWHWTIIPTPNLANVIKTPAIKASAKAIKAASTKSSKVPSGVKGATTIVSPVAAQMAASDQQRAPIHTGVFALVGLFAILYGIYEYRSDLANKIRQLRVYRRARSEARQSAKGR